MTWDVQSFEEDTIYTNIQFVDTYVAYVSGEFGTMLKSVDGGNTWEVQTPLENNFYPHVMLFENERNGWIAGLSGEILRTKDGDVSWHQEQTQTLALLYGISKTDDGVYTVGGQGVLLRRNNNE